MNNIQAIASTNSHSLATPHNPYVMDSKWCWMSSYQDGLRLFDISNPASPVEYGYFDTHPQHGLNDNFASYAYQGNWGAYPYLPSKVIIACDKQNGVFILEGDNYYRNTVVGIHEQKDSKSSFSVYPNPAKEIIDFRCSMLNEPTELTISNTLGEIITKQIISTQNSSFNVQNYTRGIYFITLSNKYFTETQKIIIQP